MNKEDFLKVWKDTSRENILNQFYYEHKTLREQYDNWNELKKWLEEVHNEENKYNFGTEDYAYNQVICYMQELEGNNE